MKSRFVALLALTLCFSGRASAAAPFTDKNLEAAVRAELHDTKTTPLTETDLNNVYFLETPGKDIKDLAGLEKCKNLAQLKLTRNQVADLKPLKDLTNLQWLDLAENKISDVTPLAGLTKLQYLELSKNQIAKVDALKGLTSLSAFSRSASRSHFFGNCVAR